MIGCHIFSRQATRWHGYRLPPLQTKENSQSAFRQAVWPKRDMRRGHTGGF